jgi:HK97 family phage prohead protease
MTEHTAPEQRTIDVDVTEVDTRGRTLHGFAAVYGAVSGDLGGFRETIAPGAFENVIGADVRCLLNHDPSQVLGRTRSGTLRLADEQRGLRFECDLPDSPLGENVREAVKRGDVDGASFRFVVDEDEWDGDLRTVKAVKELHDVTVATYGAYPDASVELRTRPTTAAERQEYRNMDDQSTVTEAPAEERAADDDETTEERTGGLQVEDRAGPPSTGSLADEFRSRGFPEETATVTFGEFRDLTLNAGTTAAMLAPVEKAGVALGADQRYAYTAFPIVPVDAGTTSVSVLRQTSRSLAAPADMQRAIDATTEKPETTSVIEVGAATLKQIATISKGIPNVYLESELVNSIVETDLRLATNAALDDLVLDGLAAAGFEAPAADPLPAIRAAITTIRAAGYNPDTLILDPATEEALDTLVAVAATSDYVFGPGSTAGSIFGLKKYVSTSAAAPVVADASAVGRLYASPVSLQRFEENDGGTNSSALRLELHALWATERIAAAVRIAAA